MFNNVDGKGFAAASRVIVKMIKELKPLLWFISVSTVVLLLIQSIAPNGLV